MGLILFLYATNNSGHQKAAEAIQKSLLDIDSKIETLDIDFFTHHYPNLGPFIFKMYIEIMRSIPQTWDYIYDNPDLAALTRELRHFFNQLNLPKLHKTLREYRPDAIVCTQTVPAGFIATEKERGKIATPLFVTITDFVANPYWPTSQVDCYFVPDEEVKSQLLLREIAGHRIKTTGIPILNSFALRIPKESARSRLRINPRLPAVLIMGGSQGIGQIPEAVEECQKVNRPVQIIVVTGQNVELYHYLKEKYAEKKNMAILGHARNMSRIMDAADLLISKPGGLTSSEALAKGLPMLILSPLPGQEERNASFLVRNGVGERCFDIASLPSLIEGFLGNREKLAGFEARTQKLARPYASDDIARHILKAVYERIDQADDRYATHNAWHA